VEVEGGDVATRMVAVVVVGEGVEGVREAERDVFGWREGHSRRGRRDRRGRIKKARRRERSKTRLRVGEVRR
jgi:hypothetical protein